MFAHSRSLLSLTALASSLMLLFLCCITTAASILLLFSALLLVLLRSSFSFFLPLQLFSFVFRFPLHRLRFPCPALSSSLHLPGTFLLLFCFFRFFSFSVFLFYFLSSFRSSVRLQKSSLTQNAPSTCKVFRRLLYQCQQALFHEFAVVCGCPVQNRCDAENGFAPMKVAELSLRKRSPMECSLACWNIELASRSRSHGLLVPAADAAPAGSLEALAFSSFSPPEEISHLPRFVHRRLRLSLASLQLRLSTKFASLLPLFPHRSLWS